MKTTQILIAGFGGQGILFAGKFLAYKGLLEDLQVSWLPSYGPEMRGGTANCTIKVNKPIIGIGAPAGVYIRWVGEVFDTDVYVTEDSDVGNAIGAITSSVSESVSFLLRPELAGEEDCKFEAFSKLGNFKYENLQEALAESERLGRESVIAAVESSGAEDVTVSVDRDERKYAIGAGESSVLMEIRLTVTAAGKPRQFTSSK